MGIKEFYNAVTPGSTITHGTGVKEDSFTKVTNDELVSAKLYESERIPVPHSILNKVSN